MSTGEPHHEARPPARRWSDREIDLIIGRVLQGGVLLATVVAVVGGTLLLLQHGHALPDFREFRGQPAMLSGLEGIVRGTLAADPRAIVQLGLVLLIATPVARVALTLVAFFMQRDRVYTAITALVLALLLYGLVWGR